MPSEYKKDRVKQIGKWFDETDNLLVLRYRGLRVAEANEIRQKLSGMDSDLRVLKNTLTRIALADTPKESLTPLFEGPVAVVFVRRDASEVAKAIKDYSKGRKEFFLLGGWLEGSVLDGRQVEAFAMLPSREVLLAQLVGAIQSPLARLAGNVAGPLRSMVGLLKAYGEKKSADSPAPEAEAAAPDAAAAEEEQAAPEAEREPPTEAETSATASEPEDVTGEDEAGEDKDEGADVGETPDGA